MLVGVAHLQSRRDVVNSTFTDDPLGPKMQAEIAAVSAKLAPFAPSNTPERGMLETFTSMQTS